MTRLAIFIIAAVLCTAAPAADLTVIAPDEAAAKTPVLVRVEKADTIEFAKLIVHPDPVDWALLRVETTTGERAYLFWSAKPGDYLFVCVGYDPAGRELHVLKHPLRYGTPNPNPGPEPGPEPDPEPEPEPEPDPGPVSSLWAIFVYESDEVDDQPWLANILTSQFIRQLGNANTRLLFADKDEKDESGQPPERTRTWTQLAASDKRPLPWLYLVNQEGQIVAQQAVPHTVAEVVALIQRYAPAAPPPGKMTITPYNPPCPTGQCPTTGRRR
jgi:hypothetical protein